MAFSKLLFFYPFSASFKHFLFVFGQQYYLGNFRESHEILKKKKSPKGQGPHWGGGWWCVGSRSKGGGITAKVFKRHNEKPVRYGSK